MKLDTTIYFMITFLLSNLIQFSKQADPTMLCTQGYAARPKIPNSSSAPVRCADDKSISTYDITQCSQNAPKPPVGMNCLNHYRGAPCEQYALDRPNQPKPFTCYRINKKAKTNPNKAFQCDNINNYMKCTGYASVVCLRSQGCTW
ncbi:uncharacterized protein MELLADRAFT_124217 [Melampsora larici-populina 98AG31]|uniref:Secreted protein n=1 Tax=Melampsora larici-populina (strain 98AG31 / pathotype 3-4-7) TaxID=747676 RepID=F4RFN4_MELLP|nr:uncharacterized protein MELLADRAFT_124217 [Melampsora larici-populina 98AG31]EGG08841.1 secreted protein [Melampsora larici-populina 98AG31]